MCLQHWQPPRGAPTHTLSAKKPPVVLPIARTAPESRVTTRCCPQETLEINPGAHHSLLLSVPVSHREIGVCFPKEGSRGRSPAGGTQHNVQRFKARSGPTSLKAALNVGKCVCPKVTRTVLCRECHVGAWSVCLVTHRSGPARFPPPRSMLQPRAEPRASSGDSRRPGRPMTSGSLASGFSFQMYKKG